MKIVSIEEVKNRIEEKYPNQPFKIIEYTRMTKPFKIKCEKCGKIKEYSSCRNYLISGNKNRKYLCSCYNKNNNLNKHLENKNTILELCNKNEETRFWYYKLCFSLHNF